ncbi:MAG: anti-sigma factor antagonist [Chloroflexi bacterium]|nr:anti-sigma factor antagonist [Chloroflexota bacterium]
MRSRDRLGWSTVDALGLVPNEIWTVRAGSAAILVVRGELDAASADETLGEVMRAMGETSHQRILIDLADVTFMDAAGLGALIRARTIANVLRIPLAIVAPSEAVRRLLRLSETDGHFRTHDCLDEALDDLSEVHGLC